MKTKIAAIGMRIQLDILDDKGKVAHVFEKVSPAGHAAAVAKVLEGLQRAEG